MDLPNASEVLIPTGVPRWVLLNALFRLAYTFRFVAAEFAAASTLSEVARPRLR
jgi:hypothetical protein